MLGAKAALHAHSPLQLNKKIALAGRYGALANVAYDSGSPQIASLMFGAADNNASTFVLPPPPPVVAEIPLPPPRPQAPTVVATAPAAPEPRPPAGRTDMAMLPDIGSRTAIYDISARTVYMPNGRKLEAHSGLGDKMDDPRHVRVKNRGPTPPNVYNLRLREALFHGVRAIRMTPVNEKDMFGRDGILAHSYMLGPNGQSNGCVSFNNYPAFLNAFLKGEVDRMVVVASMPKQPTEMLMSKRRPNERYASNAY